MDDAESAMAASLRHETHDIIAISWELHFGLTRTTTVLEHPTRYLPGTIVATQDPCMYDDYHEETPLEIYLYFNRSR